MAKSSNGFVSKTMCYIQSWSKVHNSPGEAFCCQKEHSTKKPRSQDFSKTDKYMYLFRKLQRQTMSVTVVLVDHLQGYIVFRYAARWSWGRYSVSRRQKCWLQSVLMPNIICKIHLANITLAFKWFGLKIEVGQTNWQTNRHTLHGHRQGGA